MQQRTFLALFLLLSLGQWALGMEKETFTVSSRKNTVVAWRIEANRTLHYVHFPYPGLQKSFNFAYAFNQLAVAENDQDEKTLLLYDTYELYLNDSLVRPSFDFFEPAAQLCVLKDKLYVLGHSGLALASYNLISGESKYEQSPPYTRERHADLGLFAFNDTLLMIREISQYPDFFYEFHVYDTLAERWTVKSALIKQKLGGGSNAWACRGYNHQSEPVLHLMYFDAGKCRLISFDLKAQRVTRHGDAMNVPEIALYKKGSLLALDEDSLGLFLPDSVWQHEETFSLKWTFSLATMKWSHVHESSLFRRVNE